MIGSQAIVSFMRTNGVLLAYTSPIASYGTNLQAGNLSLNVSNVAATYENSAIVIFATIKLPTNSTTIHHVWQEGPLSGDTPLIHSISPSSPNMKSFGTLDLKSGKIAEAKSGVDWKTKLKYAHGILNTISWGILMPSGVIIARYLKAFGPPNALWFNLHRGCQLVALAIGAIGWAIGIYLGQESFGVSYNLHMIMGTVCMAAATVQVLVACFLRPAKEESTRLYFNVFHYVLGLSIIGASIAAIIEGFRILSVGDIWRNLYIIVLAVLGFVALCLEALKWYNYLLQRKTIDIEKDVEKGTVATEQDLQ